MGEIKLSVKEFWHTLREQIPIIAEQNGWNFDNNAERGYAFQKWLADLIVSIETGYDTEPDDAMLFSNDLKADLVFEDSTRKLILIVQAKYQAEGKAVSEAEVNDFFNRHNQYMNRDWVVKHGSAFAVEALADYSEKIDNGYSAAYYFVSTGNASERVTELAKKCTERYTKEALNVTCELYDFPKLKEYYVRSLSIDISTPSEVRIDLRSSQVIEKDEPSPTVIAVIKGNTLRNLYQQYKESLYAWNIRGYLGNRGINQEIRRTAETEPRNFFYFNNGVSAICTEYEIEGDSTLIAKNFQVINGAQTISSLMKAGPNQDVEVLFRLTRTASVKTEKGLTRDIIKYNNSQNVVRISDFRSNDTIQLWLDTALKNWKPTEVLKKLQYYRKRSVGSKGSGYPINLELLAKIRYSFLFEPTLIFAYPKRLWSRQDEDESGVYEKAFGVENKMLDAWRDETFAECLFAIASYLKIEDEVKKTVTKSPELKFLKRLRFHALALIGHYYRKKNLVMDVPKLIKNSNAFDSVWSRTWANISHALIDAYSDAEQNKQTMFAFVRNDERWKGLVTKFDRYIALE